MKKAALLFSILLFALLPCFAQEKEASNTIIEEDNLVIQSRINQANNMTGANSNSIIYGFDNRDSAPKGDVYLFDEWVPGEVTFYEGSNVKSLFLNVDLFNQLLEIKTEGAVKVANEVQVKNFTVLRSGEKKNYISLNDYRLKNGTRIVGFAELLYSDKVKLVKRPYLFVKKEKYVPGLEVGSPTPKLIDKEEYFIIKDKKLLEVGRKMNFGEHDQEMKKYIKNNRLKHKREQDILEIVKHYNTLEK